MSCLLVVVRPEPVQVRVAFSPAPNQRRGGRAGGVEPVPTTLPDLSLPPAEVLVIPPGSAAEVERQVSRVLQRLQSLYSPFLTGQARSEQPALWGRDATGCVLESNQRSRICICRLAIVLNLLQASNRWS